MADDALYVLQPGSPPDDCKSSLMVERFHLRVADDALDVLQLGARQRQQAVVHVHQRLPHYMQPAGTQRVITNDFGL